MTLAAVALLLALDPAPWLPPGPFVAVRDVVAQTGGQLPTAGLPTR